MPPVRQSARQRARAAAQDRPAQVLHDEVTASPLLPTAAATGVVQRQLAATDATVADLRREMREIREMLQSVPWVRRVLQITTFSRGVGMGSDALPVVAYVCPTASSKQNLVSVVFHSGWRHQSRNNNNCFI